MLIFNMGAKIAAVYSFLRLYKEMESGAIRPHERLASARQGRTAAGGGGAYDMAAMSAGEDRAPVGSPNRKWGVIYRRT